MIKALETNYRGYRFRSRLEARWAVFFDSLGIRWEYETQGFLLPSGPYLPDFFLPEYQLWFEVKGQKADDEERLRCRELSYGDYCVLLSEGTIGNDTHKLTLFCFDISDSSGGESEWNVAFMLDNDGLPCLHVYNAHHAKTLVNAMWDTLEANFSDYNLVCEGAFNRVLRAEDAARSARFEHNR